MAEIGYYSKCPYHEENITAFKKFVRANPSVEFFQPQSIKAPWHVQAEINGQLLSFWPHMMKGRIEKGGEKTRTGHKHLQSLVDRARACEDFSVVD